MPDDADNRRAPFWWPDIRSVLAFMVVGACIGIVYVLVLSPPQQPLDNNAWVVIGALFSGGLISVLSFFFGSSRSSESKQDTINQIATNATNTSNGKDASHA